MKTYSVKPTEISKKWVLIDATNLILGRLAARIAVILRGKDKPIYTSHMDCGNNVIVINSELIKLTGSKSNTKNGKLYYHHSGFPGGIKVTTAGKILQSNYPERIIQLAVKRMLPSNKLGRKQFSNLYVYKGPDHPHIAQTPILYNFAAENIKNKIIV
ncbi:ribosomal protein L13 [Orientia chuto str. Dubai]|uniref:Large ribosomal subunit protein uL13 n=1 Tax=Orientia chuto str. Dubai TaxID=1359168 RepID=A0A0F3MMI9_9RICK|nr:50S ribosomal protein L13 [Candidatus Orientia mediorientalis]KJV56662.1 ribosomal protein L13 [Orientia chuto str. Dubai]